MPPLEFRRHRSLEEPVANVCRRQLASPVTLAPEQCFRKHSEPTRAGGWVRRFAGWSPRSDLAHPAQQGRGD